MACFKYGVSQTVCSWWSHIYIRQEHWESGHFRQNSEIQGLFLHKFINNKNPEDTLRAGHAEKHKVITVAV